ncbi:unnamed protein product [Ambrosiozyma monospora]|uniref:Unnamed protein product n=1 Tax=Ambrosiozyma monospora TaxID=43982 RepID=A0ACB5U2W5_AMBMO|nr:unnamed protein product [Ambrosiozyma monospora]
MFENNLSLILSSTSCNELEPSKNSASTPPERPTAASGSSTVTDFRDSKFVSGLECKISLNAQSSCTNFCEQDFIGFEWILVGLRTSKGWAIAANCLRTITSTSRYTGPLEPSFLSLLFQVTSTVGKFNFHAVKNPKNCSNLNDLTGTIPFKQSQ